MDEVLSNKSSLSSKEASCKLELLIRLMKTNYASKESIENISICKKIAQILQNQPLQQLQEDHQVVGEVLLHRVEV